MIAASDAPVDVSMIAMRRSTRSESQPSGNCITAEPMIATLMKPATCERLKPAFGRINRRDKPERRVGEADEQAAGAGKRRNPPDGRADPAASPQVALGLDRSASATGTTETQVTMLMSA